MTKVKVQDATKELSAKTGALLEQVSGLRKRGRDLLGSLQKLQEGFVREDRERREQEAGAVQKKKYEESAQFMTAYSSDQVPTIPPETVEKREAAPAAPERTTAAPIGDREPAQRQPQQGEQRFARPAQPDRGAPRQGGYQGQGAPRQGGYQGQGAPRQGGYQDRGAPRQGGYQGQGAPRQGGYQGQGGPRPGGYQGQGGPRPGGYQGQGAPRQGGFGQAGAARPAGPRPGGFAQGGPRPGGPRPGGFAQGGPRPGGFSRPKAPDIQPAVEKERVSNYDPNKKQYVRNNDPERAAGRSNGRRRDIGAVGSGYDDDFVRGKRKKKGQQKKASVEAIRIENAVMTSEHITVRDLSEKLGKPAAEIIKKLMLLGNFATINDELDFDMASLVAGEFGIELEQKLAETAEDILEKSDVEDLEEDLIHRPPVVTIMGHVDHGKTSLLDYIRSSKVTASEAGGITQHIGAYTVELNGQQITFLDTPGHEAFTSMRLRGAQATDIAVLVVAADDGVMPQTIEAINHAKAANVQVIVAINKIDKVGADPERIKQQLTEYELVCEEWGGDTIMVPVSAHTGEGVDALLESILLVAEVQDYKANPNRKARGIIIEARLDKGRGPVATVLVKNGTLNVRDTIVAGMAFGRVRAMVNDRGEQVKSAGPSCPVEVIGFSNVPEAGDTIIAVEDDSLSRQVVEERIAKAQREMVKEQQKTSLDDLFSQISAGQVKDLNIIVKADVQGSVEAVRQSLEKLTNEEVRVRVIHGAVGAINESDVMLAATSSAIIIGFNVRPDSNARDMAEREKIDVRLYRVIYQAIEEVEAAMKGMLAPKFRENLLGHAVVRQPFRITGVGTIAGSYVQDGKIARNAQIRLLRDNVVIHEGKISSLKRMKDDAREVATGYECGIGIENYNDIKENDVIECFVMEEIER